MVAVVAYEGQTLESVACQALFTWGGVTADPQCIEVWELEDPQTMAPRISFWASVTLTPIVDWGTESPKSDPF